MVSVSPELSANRSADLSALQERLGIRFRDETLLSVALTHPSYANEHPEEGGETNERLEFLGDAVLGLVVAEELYGRFPEAGEGRLTEWRAHLVMGPTLASVASSLQIGDALRLGRGEEASGGRRREGNLERAYEAVLGALMLDGGLDAARDFVRRTLADEFDGLDGEGTVLNSKGALQQLVQGERGRPEYVTVAEEGPDHARRYTVEVYIDGEVLGAGSGVSKQLAEKEAAREALEALETLEPLRRRGAEEA